MKKTLLILLILSASCRAALAQNFPYGNVTQQEMDMKKYDKDTSAHGLVLHEYGKASIIVGSDDNIKLMYEYHVKIKIFDNKAFDKGTVEIPVYNNSDIDSYEEADNIKAVTFYRDDNGLTQKVELEDKKIYPVKENKHVAIYKFAVPGLRKGCIIEYTYRIISPYFRHFHSWEFQDDIPKIYSEYDVHIPGFWNYNASLKGRLKLTKNTSEVETNCFSTHGASCDCSHIVYGMSDIPAFVEEEFMTSSKNFLSAINFQLVDETSPYDGIKRKFANEWKDIDYQLKDSPYFGSPLKRKGLFKERILPVIAGKTTDIDKAKAVYSYIQKWFKWDKAYGIYCVDGIGKVIDSHTGSVADINLSLVNALNAAGLSAQAVLLSTRGNGNINPLYPGTGDFNYLIAKVDIGDKSYLLDGADQLLPFGVLPFWCLNDKGRVFSLDKPSYWIDLTNLQKEKSTRTIELTLQDDGKLKGTLTEYTLGYSAYKRREKIKKFNSTDEYIEKLNSESPKEKILKAEITNLDSLDAPLGEKYEIEINAYDKLSDRLGFNPYFRDKISNNPFKLAERSYPVDMGMPSDERFILIIHLPASYTIENPPQASSLALPNNGGKFLTSYEADNNTLTFSHVIQFNNPIYSSEEYPYLKELYNQIIQSEKGNVIFKKK